MAQKAITIDRYNEVVCLYCHNQDKGLEAPKFTDYRNAHTHFLKAHLEEHFEAPYKAGDQKALVLWAYHFHGTARAMFLGIVLQAESGVPYDQVKVRSTEGRALCKEAKTRCLQQRNMAFNNHARKQVVGNCLICHDEVQREDGHNLCRHTTHCYHADCLEYQLERWLTANGNVMDGYVVNPGDFVRDRETGEATWIPIAWQDNGQRGKCALCPERLTAEMALAKWCELVRCRRGQGRSLDRETFPTPRPEDLRPVDNIDPVYSPDPILEETLDQMESEGDDPSDDSDYQEEVFDGEDSDSSVHGEEEEESPPQEDGSESPVEPQRNRRRSRSPSPSGSDADALLEEFLCHPIPKSPAKRLRTIPGVPEPVSDSFLNIINPRTGTPFGTNSLTNHRPGCLDWGKTTCRRGCPN
jgi:hypothetical protein